MEIAATQNAEMQRAREASERAREAAEHHAAELERRLQVGDGPGKHSSDGPQLGHWVDCEVAGGRTRVRGWGREGGVRTHVRVISRLEPSNLEGKNQEGKPAVSINATMRHYMSLCA